MNLIGLANKIIKENLSENDPSVISFRLACKKAETKILEKVRAKETDPRAISVVENFFAKLTASIPAKRAQRATQ